MTGKGRGGPGVPTRDRGWVSAVPARSRRCSKASAAPRPVPVPVPIPPGPGSYAEWAGRVRDRGGGTSISRGLDPVGSCRDTGPVPVQRGNPVLKFIRNVPWEFGDIVPDYVLGQSSCALFLRLALHMSPVHCHLVTLFIVLSLSVSLSLSLCVTVLLVTVSVNCCPNVQTLSPVSPSPEEAARYLETFKSYEQKPPDLLKERVEHDFLSRVSGLSSPHKCPLPPRMGPHVSCPFVPTQAKRLFDVLHEPFLKTPR
uniref:ERCC1-like central domain-containing protein n=1 Tax=Malurus cyaneus samueli TaxID=2593467 RepID=A0A8C5TPL0_9PASS